MGEVAEEQGNDEGRIRSQLGPDQGPVKEKRPVPDADHAVESEETGRHQVISQS